MSSVRITELPILNALSANNSNTVFVAVDKTTNTTSQFSTTTLAGGLFANNILNVGTSSPSNFPGLLAQFIGNTAPYSQINFQNANSSASMDIVLTADVGDNSNNFVDLGINNSNFTDPTFSSMKQLDGYLFVNGSSASDHVGNLVIGTTTAHTNVVFSPGGTTNLDIAAKISSSGFTLIGGRTLTFGDGSVQTTAYSATDFANVQANTIISQGVNNTQNTNITAVNGYASGAFAKANNALANTTGTFDGDLTITGNNTINGYTTISKSNFGSNASLVNITGADNGSIFAPSNTYYMLHITGKANNATRFVVDSFGANTYPLLAGRMGRGSAAAPAATANNDVLMRIAGNGYTGTQFPSSSPTKIDFMATENFSDTNRGTQIQFWNTENGSNTLTRIATFNASSVQFTGSVYPQKGFIYTPVIYPGAQTAITLDISDGPMVRAQTSSGLTVTLSNFVAGKVIELWITNTAGSTQSFTHGVSAINSTVGSTSYNMPGGSTICARYVCFDGTLSNTMCSIIHA
jgi:hypothetical protein